MTEESDCIQLLLQELATLKKLEKTGKINSAARRKRKKQITDEMKHIAEEKRKAEAESSVS